MIKKLLVKYMGYRYIYLVSYVRAINNGNGINYSNLYLTRTQPIGLNTFDSLKESDENLKDAVIIAVSYLNFEKI